MEGQSTIDEMAEAFRRVLSEGAPEGEAQRAILIKRIPIICNDIIEIKKMIGGMAGDMRWMKYLGTGLLTAVGLAALKFFGL